MTVDWKAFASEMKRRRARLAITQAELAEHADVRLATIGRLEIGNRRPSIDLLERLADVLGCRVRDLLVEETRKRTAGGKPRKGGSR
jgi:transcriptional regulator with XRE-family HTH domain